MVLEHYAEKIKRGGVGQGDNSAIALVSDGGLLIGLVDDNRVVETLSDISVSLYTFLAHV